LDEFGFPNNNGGIEEMIFMTNSPLMTIEQAAPFAGCTPTYLRRLVKDGSVASVPRYPSGYFVTMEIAESVRETLSSRATCNRDKPKTRRKPAQKRTNSTRGRG
jgi:hypothetical protein